MRALAKHTILLLLTLLSFFSIAKSKDSLSLGTGLVSAGEVFELGFFNPGRHSRWYLGIWYMKIKERTVVWVANRDNPLPNNSASLKIGYDGILSLVDESGKVSWMSSNQSQFVKNPILQLLDSGNLVLKEANETNPNEFLWQSFDYPTHTLLPEMKLGRNSNTGLDRYITSWKTPQDPSTGDYSFKLDYRGFPEAFLRQRQSIKYRSGPWNGLSFSGAPEMNTASSNGIGFKFVVNNEEMYYSFSETNPALYSRLIVSPSGNIQRLSWIESRKTWSQCWYLPRDPCDTYRECGPYGVCDANDALPVCKCMRGFRPKNPSAWSLRDGTEGCERQTELECGSKDKFMKVENLKLPESGGAVVDMEMGLEECEEKCLGNCSCSGFSSARIEKGGSGCVMWFGKLMDMRSYAGNSGQEFYLRLPASELDGDGKTKRIVMSVGIVVGIAVLLSAGLIIWFVRRRRNSGSTLRRESKGPLERIRSQDFLLNSVLVSSKKEHYSGDRSNDDLELPLFDFTSIAAATENFSDENKLGQGGFGCVYKGFVEGQEIAVKRLSKNSGQGTKEFKNEVKLIARLQHRNLVRLLGCCVDVDEKMLIYEYMENKSLDSFLFDKAKRYLLDWQKRFNIICGIARGLLYLHQDSRFRIIHRDLKASNILLDGELDPKISDFGMARLFGQDQTEANTKKVVGTYGYMSPEYAMDGLFSIKSDVFSFGVLVLEIVSGQKNRGFYYSNNELNLLGHFWELWNGGRALDIIDSSVGDSISESEVLRCMQVGLLCVQERAEDRPTMSSVVLMLCSETASLPQPKKPSFCLARKPETDESSTVNQVTITILDPR